uniref:Smr domain-containing protein n=1 Tax=Anopheles atroparvus TaxID=41427 RepID=A0AAG5D075_ANOAO
MCPDEILAKLTELFGDYIDQQRIVATIEKFNNDLDACIEALLKDEEQILHPEEPVKSKAKVEPSMNRPKGPDPSTGATRKTTIAREPQTEMPPSFAALLQKGSFPAQFQTQTKPGGYPPRRVQGKHQPPNLPVNYQNILDMVGQGYRVMVLMRGAPGSGKSHLSRSLIDCASGGDYRNHIFSADDYFVINGQYKFQPDGLDAAHRFNQKNVLAKARDGWSPIVVDNTNIRLWEMYPYVQIAADHGYHLEILEPVTHWRNNSRSLAIRNTHGVPEPKIKMMLQNYEKLTDVRELYRLCKLEDSLYIPPKMRHYPIRAQDLLISSPPENDRLASPQTSSGPDRSVQSANWVDEWEDAMRQSKNDTATGNPNGPTVNLATIPLPKPPREGQTGPTPSRGEAMEQGDEANAVGGFSQEENFSWDFTEDWRKSDSNWKPYDTESHQFWGQTSGGPLAEKSNSTATMQSTEADARPQRIPNPSYEPITEFLLSSVKHPQSISNQEQSLKPTPTAIPSQGAKEKGSKKTDKKPIAMVKHRRGCPNENASFSEICNLYPKVPVSYLWDLFEKCSGDGDWVANLLLEEQKHENFENTAAWAHLGVGSGEGVEEANSRWGLLECNCNDAAATKALNEPVPEATEAENEMDALSCSTPSSTQSPRETIRRGQAQRDGTIAVKKEIEGRFVLGNEHFSQHIQKLRLARGIVPANQTVDDDLLDGETEVGEKAADDSEVVELRLGVELVQQLHSIFKDKHCPKSLELDTILAERTRVFMATEMAEQLYLLFLDSMYSYSEEEKLFNMREDARMARLMDTEQKYPALFKPQDPSGVPNLKDIIEMEEALAAYQKETNATWQKSVPQDLAQQLSQQKLQQMFPQVNSADLLQILAAHNNRFDETVQVLNASIPETVRRQMQEKEELLKQRAESEKQKLVDLFSCPSFASPAPSSPSLSGEEAINFHLITAEECRNLAQHHLDLKNECHEKARAAIQRNVPGLADYYSQIARLHKTKIDMYNTRASNCIMEVHKLKLNNEEVLDLHYLHSQEALSCLEMFLAEHASKLLKSQQRFRTLYIITGRGLHSADGKPIIKQRVKALLRVKNIRYVEINPGFLRIKLNNRDDLEQLMVTS